MVDMKSFYLCFATIATMMVFAIIAIKKVSSIRNKFITILSIVNDIVITATAAYIMSLIYKAMNNYEAFVQKYGSISGYFTCISICFCIVQVIVVVVTNIYVYIKRNSRMIKNK